MRNAELVAERGMAEPSAGCQSSLSSDKLGQAGRQATSNQLELWELLRNCCRTVGTVAELWGTCVGTVMNSWKIKGDLSGN
jgi:hypothetical protein